MSFKDDVHVGDYVQFRRNFIKVSSRERHIELIEGYVARLGWMYVYSSKTPIASEVGFFKARSLEYYPYPPKFQVLQRRG